MIVNNITKSFDNNVILENATVNFEQNRISTILGKSGEGKTTLFRMISGLESIDQGSIEINENDKIGMVFQQNELFPHLSVLNNLVLPQRVILKRSKKNSIKRAKDTLKSLNIDYLINSSTDTLSGGEAQRVAIARTLVMDSNIILFDEPTSALDKENTDNLIQLLKTLKKDKTILIITHDLDFALQVSDAVFHIINKKIIKQSI